MLRQYLKFKLKETVSKMDNKEHTDNVLANIRNLFNKVNDRIDALKPGEKIPATVLAADLAKEMGMTGPQLYPTLKFLLNDDYPGVDIRRGAHGGIMKLPVPSATPAVVVAPAADAAPVNQE
jgi:hypothetical protein